MGVPFQSKRSRRAERDLNRYDDGGGGGDAVRRSRGRKAKFRQEGDDPLVQEGLDDPEREVERRRRVADWETGRREGGECVEREERVVAGAVRADARREVKDVGVERVVVDRRVQVCLLRVDEPTQGETLACAFAGRWPRRTGE